MIAGDDERKLVCLPGAGDVPTEPEPDPDWFDARESILRGIEALREEVLRGDVQAIFWVSLRDGPNASDDGPYASNVSWKRGIRPYKLVGAIEMAKAGLVAELSCGAYGSPIRDDSA